MKRTYYAILATLGALALSAPTQAQQQGRPPAPPFAAIGADLGVSAEAVKVCFPVPNDQGAKAGGPPPRPDLGQIADCLQKAEPGLTTDLIRAALENNRPKPPKG